MSEEFCDGVKILLKRMESNPEEFKDTDKWQEFVSVHKLANGFWGHALTPAETKALKNGMRKISREVFTTRVMATLLEDKDVKPPFSLSTATLSGSSPYQNAYPQLKITTEQKAKVLGLGHLLRQKLSGL